MMKLSVRFFNWLIIAYWSTLLFLSVFSINGSATLKSSKVLGFRSDYLLHVFLYMPWMMLAKWRCEEIKGKLVFWTALGVGIVFAGISETVQIIVPDRTFNLIDLVANCMGIVLGALISRWARRSKKVVSS